MARTLYILVTDLMLAVLVMPALAGPSVQPLVVGGVDTPGLASGVVLSGDLAFVADAAGGLQVIDVSDPTAPWVVGSYSTTPNAAANVAVSGNLAFVAEDQGALRVIDVSDPSAPSVIGSLQPAGPAFDVAVSGNWAFLSANHLQVIAIDDPSAPSLVASVETTGPARGIAVSAGHVFVAVEGNGINVIDVNDLSGFAGTCDTPGTALDVAVSGNFAFVADADAGVQVIDVSNIYAPTLVGSYDTPGAATRVAVFGSLLFVVDTAEDLLVIDVSNPAAPVGVSAVPAAELARDVAVSGELAFVADSGSGLQVIDLARPVLLSASIDCQANPESVELTFSGAMAGTGITDVGNFSINPPVTVISASAGATPDKVILQTSRLQSYESYDVTVVNLQDLAGRPMGPSDNQASFLACWSEDPDALWDLADFTETVVVAHGGGSYTIESSGGGGIGNTEYLEDRVANHVSFSRPVVITEISSYIRWLSLSTGSVGQPSPVGEGSFAATLVLRPATTGDPLTDIDWRWPEDFIPVSATLTRIGENYQVTTGGLDIALDAGSYWIGVMPSYGYLGEVSALTPYITRPYHLASQRFISPGYAYQTLLPFLPLPSGFYPGETDQSPAIKISGYEQTNPLDPSYVAAVVASDPVLYWSFEEAPLDPAQDRITQLANNALLPQQGAMRAASMPGLGSAASFSGTHDYAQTQPRFYADALSIGGPTVLDHYAIEMWVKLNDASGIQYLLEATSPSSTNAPAVIHGFSNNAGVPTLEYFGAGARTGEAGPTVLNDNQWHHLVIEADVAANTHTLYVDGQLTLQAPGAVAWQLPTLGVGATAYWDGFHGVDGLIDELAFYDLSSGPTTGARIASHYYVMFAATDAPPVASPSAQPVLYASVPNPFNPSTTIRFDLPQSGQVELTIYDVAGRRVRTLVQESMGAGSHEVIWRGVDDDGRRVASGVYLYRLEAGSYVETRRMTLIK